MGQRLVNIPFSQLRSIPSNESDMIYINHTLNNNENLLIDGNLLVFTDSGIISTNGTISVIGNIKIKDVL
jgi:hypothetical protein